MSVYGRMATEILDYSTLKRTLSELEAQLEENTRISTSEGKKHSVDIAVVGPGGKRVGFKKTKTGAYEIINESCGLSNAQRIKLDAFINKIRQRYSYHRVVDELNSQGYVIAEEEKSADNTIRLVARKWSA